MRKNIIGRKDELQQLKAAVKSPRAELIAVYGRRRVGKTFMIKEFFDNNFDFYATGIYEGKSKDEIRAFCEGFSPEFKENLPVIKDWMDAFMALRDYLKKRRGKIIVFLDELPWFDVPPGKFLKAFEWFWNSWGSTCKNLKLIVCGSSTTWMRNKFISGRGGLYNRTTHQIYLSPFKLHDAKLLLNSMGIKWSRGAILETYMALGGVPFYLTLLNPILTPSENINALFFEEGAPLRNEYDFLLKSLFKEYDYYKKIIDAIAQKNKGITRKEILEKSRIQDNGGLTRALKNLSDSDFIREYACYGKQSRDSLFQLTDPFLLFYKRFVEKYKGKDENYWSTHLQSPRSLAWHGIAFESVCLLHLNQIKKGLGIEGIATWAGSWNVFGKEEQAGAQIDLLIDRADKVIDICEMKYKEEALEVTKKLEKEIRERNGIFRSVSNTHKTIRNILVTPYGEKRGKYSGLFSKVITMVDLFQ